LTECSFHQDGLNIYNNEYKQTLSAITN